MSSVFRVAKKLSAETRSGEVLGKPVARHTSQEFVGFLQEIIDSQPRGREIHLILDNLSAHKSAAVRAGQAHPLDLPRHLSPDHLRFGSYGPLGGDGEPGWFPARRKRRGRQLAAGKRPCPACAERFDRMRVLVSAYACKPGRGSEAGVGWHSALQIARFHEAWVLTRPCNESAIREALAQRPQAGIHWVYFDLPLWARWWNRNDWGIHFHYYLWQVGAYFVGRRLHRQVKFDLAHHVTHACYWMPSFLAMLSVPLVWGPVGGGEGTPRGFWGSLSPYGKMYEIVRSIAQWIGRRDPFVRLTARRAGIGMASTDGTEVRLRELGCRETMVFPAGLPDCERLQLSGIPFRQGSPFRACSIGNLLHLKGCELGLRAFAEAQREVASSEYWIIGDGPERKRLEVLSGELGVAAKVMFWGMIPREQALERLAACDVLVHPSLHDSNPTACLEAMAAGRPVICLDLSGPALQVTGESGIKVPALTPKQAVTGLASAMVRLARDPALRERMGRAARRRVEEHYSLDRKGETWAGIYERVVRRVHPSTQEPSHRD